jgi:hypothetical protein
MNKLLIASAFASLSLFAGSAEAACRQVYGGTSCNWMGQCWHNPPKTVCDAPPPRIAGPPASPNRFTVQPNTGGGGILSQNGVNMRGGGVISTDGAGLIGNAGGAMRR